jgi:uncharacterized membrane protein YraQ (UPF0718 family)
MDHAHGSSSVTTKRGQIISDVVVQSSLLVKGLGAGGATIPLIVGVGTNVFTLGPVAGVMGPHIVVLYAGSVVVLGAVCGVGLNRVL